jgi:hypothetical protein
VFRILRDGGNSSAKISGSRVQDRAIYVGNSQWSHLNCYMLYQLLDLDATRILEGRSLIHIWFHFWHNIVFEVRLCL